MKKFLSRWGHGLMILYAAIYMPCFIYLENHVTDFYPIHSVIDDYIPFCEVFIIPYFLWFVFMAFWILYFFFRSQGECIRMGASLIIGMSIAVIIYFVFPNGLEGFRPDEFPRDNIFTDMVKFLHTADTPTNVFPSLHVYNTLAITVAVFKSQTFGKYRKCIRITTIILTILICMSTVFLKQHSILDVFASVILIALIYPITYHTKFFNNFK